MPEFYMIFARKIFPDFFFWGGEGQVSHPSPVSYAYADKAYKYLLCVYIARDDCRKKSEQKRTAAAINAYECIHFLAVIRATSSSPMALTVMTYSTRPKRFRLVVLP